jgi:hypothetical protein
MPDYVFAGDHAGAVTAELAPPGADKLRRWAQEASTDGGGDVVALACRPGCSVSLRLKEALAAPASWSAGEGGREVFSAGGAALEARVTAASPEDCYAVLKKHLFRLQPDRGEAAFPVSVASVPAGGAVPDVVLMIADMGEAVRVHEVLTGAGVDLEVLVVRVTREEGDAAFWKEA